MSASRRARRSPPAVSDALPALPPEAPASLAGPSPAQWIAAAPWRLPLLLAVAAALFRLPWLGLPAAEVFDEVYHAKTALQYLRGEPPIEWVHPPTAKLLIAVGVWAFGYNAWAWRLMPALAGIALAPVFYLLARQVLTRPRAVVLACVLLLCDGVYLVQSRIAMTNIFAVLFQLSSAALVLHAVRKERLPAGVMAAAGLTLGLALSTRWTSLWAWGFLGLVLLVARGRRVLRPREVGLVVLAFAVLPTYVYVLSYLPWMHQQRFALSTPGGWWTALSELGRLQMAIWRYHATLNATHPYFSAWYTWPWLYRPTWYHFSQQNGWIRGIVAIGNPALWWASVPITLWALVTGLRERDWRPLLAAGGFLLLYLPWGISPRTLNYSHYLFEAIPYACLSLGLLLDRHWDDAGGGSWARSYVALVVALFFFFYPFLAALPVPQEWYYHRLFHNVRPWTWFSTWV
ncbi:MAG TPA: phospholipid carrier-dependent glycosyltransferase [Vicinamibacteria bacterium]|nr:phospholipid carrier-dependent glycosyltransferase [Vicinamibacteria bacterium]